MSFPYVIIRSPINLHLRKILSSILIQLDTLAHRSLGAGGKPQHFHFQPEKHILNKFDVFTEIPVTPLNLLLAQKFYPIVNRKRSKGRDFFDVIFLLSKNIKPNYDYLQMKLGIGDSIGLKTKILSVCSKLDMKAMADNVVPFLFNPADAKKVELFEKYLKQVEL